MSIPTFVINMEKDKEKWAMMQKNFHSSPLQLERFNAIVGKEIRNDPDANISNTCRMFCTDGMIGAMASHLTVLEMIVDQHIPKAIVLEDDVSPIPEFNEILLKVWNNYLPDDFDLVMMGYAFGHIYPEKDWFSKLMNFLVGSKNRIPRQVNEYIHVPYNLLGAQGYIISWKGAKKLLDKIKKISYHVDHVMYSSDINLYVIQPFLLKHDGAISGSSLGEKHNVNLSFLNHIQLNGAPLSWGLYEPQSQIGGIKVHAANIILFTIICLLLYFWLKKRVIIYIWIIIMAIRSIISSHLEHCSRTNCD